MENKKRVTKYTKSIQYVRINIFSIKDLAKKRDNVFVYIFIKICANFSKVGRMKITQNL